MEAGPSDALLRAERALLESIQQGDLAGLAGMLTEDFVITTAGWIAKPASRAEWLEGLAGHELDEFDLRVLTERDYGGIAVVLIESNQAGRHRGDPWAYTFRYTDVWRRLEGSWRLAVRHASATPVNAT